MRVLAQKDIVFDLSDPDARAKKILDAQKLFSTLFIEEEKISFKDRRTDHRKAEDQMYESKFSLHEKHRLGTYLGRGENKGDVISGDHQNRNAKRTQPVREPKTD